MPQPKIIRGIDTPDGQGGWDWRGRGLLKMTTSHWEVLGWGEKEDEKWAVTWFAPSMFTPEGLDIYCNNKEGITPELYHEIQAALQALESRNTADLAEAEMRPVEIAYDDGE